MFGYTQAEIEAGVNCFEVFVSKDVGRARRNFRLALEGQDLTGIEYTAQRTDGTQFPVMVHSAPILRDGAPAGLRGIVIDVTERKRFEKSLQESEAVLNEAQEIAGIGSFVWDLQRDFLSCSQNMFRLAGLDRNDVADDTRVAMTQLIHPDDLAEVQGQIERMVATKQTWPFEFRVVRPDGSERVWQSHARFICDDAGTPLKCVGIHRDVTEQRQAESEREITVEVLRLLSQRNTRRELLQSVTALLHEWSGCDAVGVRLREGEDFPYFETRGFPPEFVLAENRLCAVDARGNCSGIARATRSSSACVAT